MELWQEFLGFRLPDPNQFSPDYNPSPDKTFSASAYDPKPGDLPPKVALPSFSAPESTAQARILASLDILLRSLEAKHALPPFPSLAVRSDLRNFPSTPIVFEGSETQSGYYFQQLMNPLWELVELLFVACGEGPVVVNCDTAPFIAGQRGDATLSARSPTRTTQVSVKYKSPAVLIANAGVRGLQSKLNFARSYGKVTGAAAIATKVRHLPLSFLGG